MSDQRKNTPSVQRFWNKNLEAAIEDRFRDWASELVTRERWHNALRDLNAGPFHEDSKWREKQLLGVVREFSGDYTSLLEKAVIESTRELRAMIQGRKITLNEKSRHEVIDGTFRFVQRFTTGAYERPWEGFFMLPPADSGEVPDERTLGVDFQRGNSLARLFQEAQDRLTSETVTALFLQETEAGKWRGRAGQRASNELRLVTVESRTQLTHREERMWEVIQRGTKGLAYCRELKSASLRPPTSWVRDGCPADYPAAYQEGKPWQHRIQDEKTKVRRKAERGRNSPSE